MNILFLSGNCTVLSNVLNTPGTLAGNNAPVCLDGCRYLVDGSVF
ncbi:hypothetical protein [Parabacteroides goldsteinii]|nr:hypothetical protein [Parabacteroides goldsteinii]